MIEAAAGGSARPASDTHSEPGIFARIFPRPSAAGVARAVADAGFRLVQLNFSSFGLPTLPDPVAGPDEGPAYREIGEVFAASGVTIWGLSGTYNIIHPDTVRRRRETAAAKELIAHARLTGASVVTLCTGTRDPENMWRSHPDNGDAAAWHDMRATIDELLGAAAAAGIRLGVEPEPANVVADAAKACRLLEELGPDSGLVGIVLDPANLLTTAEPEVSDTILSDAFERLASAVVCLHAKDTGDDGFSAPGSGSLDFDLVYRLRQTLPRPVPVVIQDTPEAAAPEARDFLLRLAREHPWQPREAHP